MIMSGAASSRTKYSGNVNTSLFFIALFAGLLAMPKPKLDPIRARNLSNDYAKWLLQEKRERTPASGKLFAQRHTTGGRRYHGFNQEQICTIIGGDYYE